jgi:hypothetical protein
MRSRDAEDGSSAHPGETDAVKTPFQKPYRDLRIAFGKLGRRRRNGGFAEVPVADFEP